MSRIAHLSGFNNQSHFNRVFLNHKQSTPTEFRKKRVK
ncbi:MAG: helix-turn-helix domain-containing protein [Bacteroidota bacterium]